MNRKLTKEEVAVLFYFCENEGVCDYDLQIELVDHLASHIEDQWKTDPEIEFETAVENLYSKFGWKEFRKLETQMKRQLKRKFRRMLWQNFLEYFRLPKIAVTFIIMVSVFSVLRVTENNSLAIIILTIPFSLVSLYYAFILFPKKIKVKTTHNKSFMILKYLESKSTLTGSIIQLPLFAITFSRVFKYTNTISEEILISAIISILTVFLYGYFFFLPKKIRMYFMLHYSEFAQ
jgi:hypothetical protein